MHFQTLFAFSILPLFLAGEAIAVTHVPNSQVVAEIEDHLYHANVLKHGHVEVTFIDGVAKLKGTVDSIGVKTDAETATWKDEDVSQVVNQIVVGTIAVDPNQIVNDARRRILNHYANSIFDNIEVDSQGSTLIVHGQVTQPYKKEAVGYFLTHVRGVVAIENKIQILPLSVDDDDLRMRLARAIYDDPSFAKYAETAHPPIHIIVDGENVTLAGTVDSDLDKSRAGQDAQLVLKYLSLHNNLRVVGQETRQ